MKRFMVRMIFALVLSTTIASVASAKVKSRVVTFGQDFVVNGTSIKKGTYKLNFDDKTNELTIAEKDSVVVKTAARLETRKGNTSSMGIDLVPKDGKQVLVSVAFPGDNQSIVVSSAQQSEAAK